MFTLRKLPSSSKSAAQAYHSHIAYHRSILYSVSVVVPSEIGAAGGLYQVMTSLAPAFGNVRPAYLVCENAKLAC